MKYKIILSTIIASFFFCQNSKAELTQEQEDAMWKCAKMYVDMDTTCRLEDLFDQHKQAMCNQEAQAGYLNCIKRNANI